MRFSELNEIAQVFNCTYGAAAFGFRHGYIKGGRAQKKADQEIPENPKGKPEYRQAVAGMANEVKSIYDLKNIHKMMDIMIKARNEELYKTLTDSEWSILFIMRSILNCDDISKLKQLNVVADTLSCQRKGKRHD